MKQRTALAFQPGSHYILMEKCSEKLPEGIIKDALKTYPKIAAWGANGPDLGLIQIGQPFGWSPWSSRHHYDRIGSFVSEMLKSAIEKNNKKEIAFAAGWATHIGGDMGCHGIFVNPECGVTLDNPEGKELHTALERAAEPYVWTHFGGKSEKKYKEVGIADKFSDVSEIPFDLIIETCNKIYGCAPSELELKTWATTLHVALKTGVGYKYLSLNEGENFLNISNRAERLKSGFKSALGRCVRMLTDAECGDYSYFDDGWNIDVGRSDSPISNLVVEVKTSSKFGAGTDDDIFFGIKTKDNKIEEWKLDTGKASGITVNDFESGDRDNFYLYVNRFSSHINPTNIKSVYLKKEKFKFSFAGDWHLESFKILANGEVALSKEVDAWVTDSNNYLEFKADFSHIKGEKDAPDPIIEI